MKVPRLDPPVIIQMDRYFAPGGRKSRNTFAARRQKCSQSEPNVPPSKRAAISRFPQASNPKADWLQAVIGAYLKRKLQESEAGKLRLRFDERGVA